MPAAEPYLRTKHTGFSLPCLSPQWIPACPPKTNDQLLAVLSPGTGNRKAEEAQSLEPGHQSLMVFALISDMKSILQIYRLQAACSGTTMTFHDLATSAKVHISVAKVYDALASSACLAWHDGELQLEPGPSTAVERGLAMCTRCTAEAPMRWQQDAQPQSAPPPPIGGGKPAALCTGSLASAKHTACPFYLGHSQIKGTQEKPFQSSTCKLLPITHFETLLNFGNVTCRHTARPCQVFQADFCGLNSLEALSSAQRRVCFHLNLHVAMGAADG